MFCKTVGPPNAKIMLVGEAPGAEEDLQGVPFIGAAGKTLDMVLSQAGITRYECLVTNVARERPPANKISFFFEDKKCTIPKPKLKEWIQLLRTEIVFNRPNVIVALGNTALWALTGERKISEFRGYIIPCSLVEGFKVIPTYHPMALNHEWKLLFPTVMDLRKAKRHSEFPTIPDDNRMLIADISPSKFVDYCNEIANDNNVDYIAVDIETLQPGTHIDILGVAHSPDFGVSVRVINGRTPTMPERDEEKLWSAFNYLLQKKPVVMQNGSYDKGVLWYNNHILIKNNFFDTVIAAHCCWPECPRDLGFLASLCLDVAPWKGGAKDNRSLYNAGDVCNTHALVPVLKSEMNKMGVTKTFDFEMSLIDLSVMMQLQGMKINKDRQKELKYEAEQNAKEAKEKLTTLVGKDINYNSPKQLQQLLYIDLGLPIQYKKRKSVNDPRVVSADATALKKISIQIPDNPIFNMILEYKKWSKLGTSFLNISLSPNDTVHTSYNITGSSTDEEGRKSFGRWSSSKSIILPYGSGNLQNIPAMARKMYGVEEDEVMIQADYVQAEAVVVAYLTGNNRLKQMFKTSYGLVGKARDPYDIHKITASEMFGIPFASITAQQRKVGKTIRHSSNYAAGPAVLAVRLGIKMREAKQLMELYHRADPLLRVWYQRIQSELRESRTLTNLLGRKHRFLARWGDDLFRSAYSFKPQSTVGDLLNEAMKRFYDNCGSMYRLLMQLHDAQYVACKEYEKEFCSKSMYDSMCIPLKINEETFMIDIDFKIGKTWGEMVEWIPEWRKTKCDIST
jgi:uracil-DNA glycosylase family 4